MLDREQSQSGLHSPYFNMGPSISFFLRAINLLILELFQTAQIKSKNTQMWLLETWVQLGQGLPVICQVEQCQTSVVIFWLEKHTQSYETYGIT